MATEELAVTGSSDLPYWSAGTALSDHIETSVGLWSMSNVSRNDGCRRSEQRTPCHPQASTPVPVTEHRLSWERLLSGNLESPEFNFSRFSSNGDQNNESSVFEGFHELLPPHPLLLVREKAGSAA